MSIGRDKVQKNFYLYGGRLRSVYLRALCLPMPIFLHDCLMLDLVLKIRIKRKAKFPK